MGRGSRSSFVLCLLVVAAVFASLTFGEVSGVRTGRTRTFTGKLSTGTGETQFTITLEPVSFAVTSVANKYKLVEVAIMNRSTAPIALSSDQDRFEAIVGGQAVPAVLSLQRADSTLWDSFSVDRRKDLAYPVRVTAGAADRGGITPEFVSLFEVSAGRPRTRTPE